MFRLDSAPSPIPRFSLLMSHRDNNNGVIVDSVNQTEGIPNKQQAANFRLYLSSKQRIGFGKADRAI